MTATTVDPDPLSKVDVHPAAELFPLMTGDVFTDLVNDIREHGQRDPCVMTPDGQLLDGRNRWRACSAAGIRPVTRVEESEPWAFVISTNVHRRHLNESQRAMIAARIAERVRGGTGANQHRHGADPRIRGSATERDIPPTQREAAKLLNVGETSITEARRVMAKGTEPLQKLVESGQVPVSTAARVARTLPKEEQDAYVQRVAAGEDARKIAPPYRPTTPEVPPKVDGNGNGAGKQYRRSDVISRHAIASFVSTLGGMAMGLRDITAVDPNITPEEAAQFAADLNKGAASIRKLINLLKETP